MDLGTILVTTTARDTMLPATIGDHMDIGTTSVPTGGIDTGGIAAGTGIEMAYGSTGFQPLSCSQRTNSVSSFPGG
jgi:hypothetical protein